MKLSAMQTRKIKRGLFMAAMMGPAIVGFLIFYVYVNFNSLLMAFQVRGKSDITWGFGNFTYFFSQLRVPGSVFVEAIRNTAIFFVLGYFQLLLSMLVAYFLFKKVAGYKFFRFVYYMPCIIMATATASLFQYVIARSGPIGAVLRLFSKEMPPLLSDSAYANKTLMFYCVFYGIGGNMILFLGSMTNISPEVFEAARLDGVGWLREVFQLIVPLIWPTLSVMILQSVVGLTQASGPVFLFTQGSYGTYTINYWLYEQLLGGINLEISAAIGWCCTLVTFPIALLVKHYLDRVDDRIGV